MTIAWCGCSPEEELSMISGIAARSTKCFSLDRNSSYSISLTFVWLPSRIYIGMPNRSKFRDDLLSGEGREQFLYDIFLVQFRLNIFESNITKFSQSHLGEILSVPIPPRTGVGQTLFARLYMDFGEHGPTVTTSGGRVLSPSRSCEGLGSISEGPF